MESANTELVRRYLAALQDFKPADDIAQFFHPQVRQIEHPNRLNPKGGESDLPTLLKRIDLGRKLLREQTFSIQSMMAQGGKVAVQAQWSGTVDVPLATLEPGARLRAHLAMFFELENGRIVRQHSYDCFEP